MKKLFYHTILLLLFAGHLGLAQSTTENYVRTAELLISMQPEEFNWNDSNTLKIDNITYFDGFGKIKQTVGLHQTPSKKDVIHFFEYDGFGRTSKRYLPLPSQQNSGNYDPNAKIGIEVFYENRFADQHPFSQTIYDDSPLNRITEVAAPGNTWQIANHHTSKRSYHTNIFNEVLRFDINHNSIVEPLSISHYSPSELMKVTIKNENWEVMDGQINTVDIYTDKDGREVASTTYENHNGQLRALTKYQVYDNSGNLRYVLPPKLFHPEEMPDYDDYNVSWPINDFVELGTSISNVNFEVTANVLKLRTGLQSTSGAADKRLRPQTVKTIALSPSLPNMYLGEVKGSLPLVDGATVPTSIKVGEVHIENGNLIFNRTSSQLFVALFIDIEIDLNENQINKNSLDALAFQYQYDEYNRQIAQKVPGKEWEYVVFDYLDRPVFTQDAKLRENDLWLFNKYDVYGRLIYNGLYTSNVTREVLQNQLNTFINSTSNNQANIEERRTLPLTIGGVSINYTNNAFPIENFEILGVTFYDDYAFSDDHLPNIPLTIQGQEVTDRTKNLTTSVWTKTLGENSWAKTYTFYDNKGRPIWVFERNHLGGNTSVKNKLDFRGKTLQTETTHQRTALNIPITIVDKFEYDHVERPLKYYQKTNDQFEELLFHNHYNEIGELETREVGGKKDNNQNSFTDLVNVTVEGNVISRTSTAAGWNAGLATTGEITGDGFVSFKTNANQHFMAGLSSDNSSASFSTIDYAIFVSPTNHGTGGKQIKIYENGTFKGIRTNYYGGETFSVERENNRIFYKKNGIVFYESLTTSTAKLIGDVSIGNPSSQILDFKISSLFTDIVGLDVVSDATDSNRIMKNTGINGWNSGLATTNFIGGNGKLTYAVESAKNTMVGLSETNPNAHFNTIKYAIYTRSNYTIGIYEQGTYKGNFGHYSLGDEFSVERKNNSISYYKNGVLLYESSLNSTAPLFGDISMHEVGAAIRDLKIQIKALQTMNYAYNIRGWRTNLNNVDNLGEDLFGYQIRYDENTIGNAVVPDRYDGQIKQFIWASAYDNTKKAYSYAYDDLDRLVDTHYRENTFLSNGDGKYETYGIRYDANGNIKRLNRNTHTGEVMDRLLYSYDSGNKLLSIGDFGGTDAGFNDGNTTSSDDYEYDNNGNLIRDLNKGIISITYNHLDLVENVLFLNGSSIQFLYDASGAKLKMKTHSNGNTVNTDYLGGFQYSNNVLQFFPTSEGYVDASNGTFKYVYTYFDYLGNNQLSYSDVDGNNNISNNEILSNTDYYAFGLTHAGELITNSNYRYKYQGKEELTEFDYNMYDFGSRMYDPSVGRWFNTDPQNQFDSPYLFSFNNPINSIDPDGEFAIVAAIAIGVAINVSTQALSGNINSTGDFLGSVAVGAVSGLAGAAAGSAVTGSVNSAIAAGTSTGSFASTLSGAASGASGSFASGFGNTLVNGGNIGNALSNGSKEGLVGGLFGGVLGGIQDISRNARINRTLNSVNDDPLQVKSDGSLTPSTETLEEFSDLYYDGFRYRDDARLLYDNEFVLALDAKNKVLPGTIKANTATIRTDGKYSVRFGDSAFSSKKQLFVTMGHEYVHVAHQVRGLPLDVNISFRGNTYRADPAEYGAYSYEDYVNGNFTYTGRIERLKVPIPKSHTLSLKIRNILRPYVNYHRWGLPNRIPNFQ